jgi:hypothetical protein
MFDSLPVRRALAPRNRVHAAGRSISILLRLFSDQADALAGGPRVNTDGFLIDETGVGAAVPIDQIEGVAREVVGMAAGFAFDEVGVLISCRDRSVSTG